MCLECGKLNYTREELLDAELVSDTHFHFLQAWIDDTMLRNYPDDDREECVWRN